MSDRRESFRDKLHRSLEIERGWEKHFVRFSRILWPWRETWLILVIGCLAMLDFASTYAFLKLRPNEYFVEGGWFAGWALHHGGFLGLFAFDILAVGIISGLALMVRYIVTRVGFAGYGVLGSALSHSHAGWSAAAARQPKLSSSYSSCS